MTRIVSYNILAGGYDMRAANARRTTQIIKMIQQVKPDIVGVVEAIHPQIMQPPTVLAEIAEELGMQVVTGDPRHCEGYQLALLTRLPVVSYKVHERPGILARPLLEVCVEEENGEHLTVCVTHLSAAFNRGRGGGGVRLREVEEILRITAPLRAEGKPHLIMGDFNSLAPGDAFKASGLLRYIIQMDRTAKKIYYDGHPNFNAVVPPHLRFLRPVFNAVADSDLLCSLFDLAAYLYAPRGCIRDLKRLYVDSYRHMHPDEPGFTCPAAAPAGRIDYIFTSPLLADRLNDCDVLRIGEDGITGDQASDHLPITAEIALRVASEGTKAVVDNVDRIADSVVGD
jgi:endonuclease/exonuclease/phosphatase family metal-dependent hydrolase